LITGTGQEIILNFGETTGLEENGAGYYMIQILDSAFGNPTPTRTIPLVLPWNRTDQDGLTRHGVLFYSEG
jgi:hypothetical protein